jgi:MFS family permease
MNFAALRALPSTVWLIGLISLCNDSASEMLYPLLPLYLSSVLMSGPKTLGIIEGLAEAVASLFKLVSGVIVDRTRTAKPWIVVGYLLAGIGRPLIAFTTSWSGVMVIRVADRIGKGLRSSPRDALLAEAAGSAHRGLAYGLHRAMDNTGAVIGPLLASLLLALHVPLRDIFFWAIIPGVVTLVLALALREPKRAIRTAARVPFSWNMPNLSPRFKCYLFVVGLFSLGNSSNMFLLLRAQELGVPQAQIPLLWAAVSALAALLLTPMSGLSDRWGRRRFIVAGWALYAVVYVLLGMAPLGSASLFMTFAAYGVFVAATEGVEKALVADLAPSGQTGTAFGWFNLITGVMLFPASFIFGELYEHAGAAIAFGFSASCALLAALLLPLLVFGRSDERSACVTPPRRRNKPSSLTANPK